MKIDYMNNQKGMRQDFTIYKKPKNVQGFLTLSLQISTEERLLVGADALVIKSQDHVEFMKYNSLKIWDTQGRELRGWFEVVSNNMYDNTKEVQIVVNDSDAEYPIIIDPLSNTESWHVENSGTFGASVATEGDAKGDGSSDIIIGVKDFSEGQAREGVAFVLMGLHLVFQPRIE